MEQISNAFVVLMGIGTVFVGLILIILFCKIIGFFCTLGKKEPAPAPAAPAESRIENRGEMIAAVSAALAEELGTEVEALRIHSFKKL